jgi:CRP-like cAMP-binding protein
MRDGRAVEVGSVGPEGAVCLSAVLALDTAATEAVVLLPGAALRLPSTALREAAERDLALDRLLRGYAACALAQITQTAACNRLHSLNERCIRWLLVAHDNAGDESFPITHEGLATILGVQRPGVSLAARALQDAGLISYRNGRVRVTDRARLEAGACECYRTVRRRFDALFAAT